jgi:UV DNA damage endonuclease
MYRTGYCCINLSIGDNFKTMKLGWAEKNRAAVDEKWQAVVTHNFNLLEKIIKWNINNNIFLYRISSDLVPFADHDDFGSLWRNGLANGWANGVSEGARLALKLYLSMGGRVTIHPGQFVSLGSPNPETRRKSMANLEYHGQLLTLLGLPENYNCPINIHVSNGTRPNEIIDNVKNSITLMTERVTRRLVFENEQNGYWTPINLKNNFPNIPITFDYHHYSLNPDPEVTIEEAVEFTSKTWPNMDPVQHYSEGRDGPDDPAHSDFVNKLPDSMYDIEVEAKKKDLSIMSFLNNRNTLVTNVLY